MATKVVMEALSPTMEEGRLVSWKKREGDTIAVGDVLAEVETDKAVMEMVARTGGVLRTIVVAEGGTVAVSATIGIIAGADEDISTLLAGTEGAEGTEGTKGAANPAGPSGPVVAERGLQATEAHASTTVAATEPAPDPRGRVRSSPLARKLAAARGVDIAAVAGTGPDGRVVARDIDAADKAAPAPGSSDTVAPSHRPTVPSGFRDVPLSQMRKTIAKRLVQSLGPVPHFFLTSEIDMERAWEARGDLKAKGDATTVSFNDLVIKAVALALRRHPAVNAWWMDDHIRYHGDVHVGMAVAVEDGLITPVIRFADRKGLAEISAEARALAAKARARRLTPEEYTGATFSVSNLGMLDIDEFTAIINPPESGILAVGRIVQKPVVHEGAVVPRRMMRVTMSCDHRTIDGATGARFLQSVKLMLENPLAMVL